MTKPMTIKALKKATNTLLVEYSPEVIFAAAAALRAEAAPPKLSEAKEVVDWLISKCPEILVGDRERFHVIGLNVGCRPLFVEEIGIGGLASCPVDPRDVFRRAMLEGANAIILAHNHPSGDATPSASDLTMTARMAAAGQLLGVQVVDHIIVVLKGHYSMAEAGSLGG